MNLIDIINVTDYMQVSQLVTVFVRDKLDLCLREVKGLDSHNVDSPTTDDSSRDIEE